MENGQRGIFFSDYGLKAAAIVNDMIILIYLVITFRKPVYDYIRSNHIIVAQCSGKFAIVFYYVSKI